MPHPIVVTFDHAQNRVYPDRLGILGEGSYPAERGGRVSGWDLVNSTNIWQDKITYTAMLEPTVLSSTWDTTNAGVTAKYKIADLTFSDSSDWEDIDTSASVGWLHKPECSSDSFWTTSNLPNINQPMYLAYFNHAAADDFIAVECGWSTNGTDGVLLRFYISGQVEIWKGGEMVGSGKISGGQTEQGTQNQWVKVLLIPFRRRELLVYSTAGSGFSHLFVDLVEDGTVKEIVPAAKFYVKKPSGTATIQLAKLQFATSGTLYSEKLYFADPPATGAVAETRAYSDSPGYGSTGVTLTAQASDLSGAFVPNDVLDNARIKLALTGGPSATPFVYAGLFAYPPTIVQTDGLTPVDLAYSSLQIDVPDSPGGVKATVGCYDPGSSGIVKLDMLSNRPVKITSDSKVIIDGRAGEARIKESSHSETDFLTLDILGEWQALENYIFQERIPLDGVTWVDCLEFFLGTAGWDLTKIDIEDPSLTVGTAGSPTAGEWSLVIEPGDSCAEWIERLFEGFAGDWFFGFLPKPTGTEFVAKSPTGLSTASDIELFLKIEDAKAQLITDGLTADEAEKLAHTRTVKGMEQKRVRAEANDIRVTGYDLRTNKFLQAKYIDSNSLDPTTLVASRPDNWMGERLRFAYTEPMLTEQSLVDDAATKLGERMTRVRTLIDFTSDFVFLATGEPLWRGHVVTINSLKYRIRSLCCKIEKDAGSGTDPWKDWIWRETRYTAELIDGSVPWAVSTGQIGAKAISAAQAMRLAKQGARNLHRITNQIGARRG